MENDSYVWQFFSNFLEKEPTPGIDFEYAFVNQVLPGITLEEVNAQAKEWITNDNRVIAIMAPQTPDIKDTE